jgi:NADH:ubiquinone oxidoreductase subunit C
MNFKESKISISLTKFNLLSYLLNILPYFLNFKIVFNSKQNILNLFVDRIDLIFLLNFLKKHNKLRFETLIGITAVDYPEDNFRFELNYFLLSYQLNCRIVIKVLTNDYLPIESVSFLYNSAT